MSSSNIQRGPGGAEVRDDIKKIDLTLLNIQERVTPEKNKSRALKNLMGTGKFKILRLTETHMNHHFEAEITSNLEDSNLKKTDRDVSQQNPDAD